MMKMGGILFVGILKSHLRKEHDERQVNCEECCTFLGLHLFFILRQQSEQEKPTSSKGYSKGPPTQIETNERTNKINKMK